MIQTKACHSLNHSCCERGSLSVLVGWNKAGITIHDVVTNNSVCVNFRDCYSQIMILMIVTIAASFTRIT